MLAGFWMFTGMSDCDTPPKHAREPLYSKSAVIVVLLQSTRAQSSVPGC